MKEFCAIILSELGIKEILNTRKRIMKYYLAPMEGITTYVFRHAYHKTYHPMDKYFTPFIVPHKQKGMSEREWGELNPEHNAGMYVVPQILTNDAEDFVKTAKMLYEYGYKEANLNLGCPSKTVVWVATQMRPP